MTILKNIYKSNENKIFLGVLGGLAEEFGIDAVWVRLIYVLLALGSMGLFTIIYFILAYLMPSRPYWK